MHCGQHYDTAVANCQPCDQVTTGFGPQATTGDYCQDPFDGSPFCFSWPYVLSELGYPTIKVTLNTGEIVYPYVTATPNQEPNEAQCIVLFGNIGNRITPNSTNGCASIRDATKTADSCAFYPVEYEIVRDLHFIGPPDGASMSDGPWTQDTVQLKNARGMKWYYGISATAASQSTLQDGSTVTSAPAGHGYASGPVLCGAHLTRFTGDAGSTNNNGCNYVFPLAYCQYQLRFFYTGGYTPNGISGMRPTSYETYYRLVATGPDGNDLFLTNTGVNYTTANGGTVRVVGLAELGQNGAAQEYPTPFANCTSAGGKGQHVRCGPHPCSPLVGGNTGLDQAYEALHEEDVAHHHACTST
jgi:hypothetical protein